MELAQLKAPRPTVPRLSSSDKRIQAILRDLEKIKQSKPSKQLKRCSNLIHYITHSLRKSGDDHLLHTTAIWVLITIFRILPNETKSVMLAVGVPGVLYDIIKLGNLSGSSRQYASELCFYLSTNHPHPGTDASGAPMKNMPDVEVANRYQPDLDDISIISDVSTTADDKDLGRRFVPYRINDENMHKMDCLFEQGYHRQLAASLPNTLLMSKYGFQAEDSMEERIRSKKLKKISVKKRLSTAKEVGSSDEDSLGKSDDSDSDNNEDLDDDFSAVSTLSSSSRSKAFSASAHGYLGGRPQPRRDSNASDRSVASSNGPGPTSGAISLRPSTSTAVELFKLGQNGYMKRPKQAFIQPWDTGEDSIRDVNVPSAPHRMVHQLRQQHYTPEQHRELIYQHRHQDSKSDENITPRDKKEGIFNLWVTPTPKVVPSKGRALPPQRSSFFSPPEESLESSPGSLVIGQKKDSADIDEYFSSIDPLNLSVRSTLRVENANAKMAESEQLLSDAEEENNEEDDMFLDSDEEDGKMASTIMRGIDLEAEDNDEEPNLDNEFVRKRRLRMRAEKLIDHSFIKKLFVKKAKIRDTQNLIYRMESLLQLLDPDGSGYVTFEQFTRVILAIAPSHLVRADVLSFFEAQTKCMDDLIDYNEFIISGKVLVLTRQQRAQIMLDKSIKKLPDGAGDAFAHRIESTSTLIWLKRQKQYTGESSTLTWQNHMKWYQKRKGQALIWLIRRATRSMKHEVILYEAQRFLWIKAKQAKAMSFLMGIGLAALKTLDNGKQARKVLLLRVMKARQFSLRVTEAIEFLRSTAQGAIRDLEYMDRVRAIRNDYQIAKEEEATKVVASKSLQANYATLFKVLNLQKLAFSFLREKSKHALQHSARQDDAYRGIRRYVQKVLDQMVAKDKARRELLLRAEAAYEHCDRQDQKLMGLLRLGAKAVAFVQRREICKEFLYEKGRQALEFTSKKDSTGFELVQYGLRVLHIMNEREFSFIYLNERRIRSIAHIKRRTEALKFLREKPKEFWVIIDRNIYAQDWLLERAKRAKDHAVQRITASIQLHYIAGKSKTAYRRKFIAQQELAQIGLIAKVQYFKVTCQHNKKFMRMVKTERRRIEKIDARLSASRSSWNVELRIKVEFAEAFQLLSSVYTPEYLLLKKPMKKIDALVKGHVEEDNEEDLLLGRYALQIMLNKGRVLNVNEIAVDEAFKSSDLGGSCFVTYADILPWLRKRALKVNGFKYRITDVLSAEERAYFEVWKQCLNDKNLQWSADINWDEWNSIQPKRSRRKYEDSDSEYSDEEEEDEEMDEEMLFADLEKLRNMDVGKLMRYLTKKKQEAADAASEAAAKALQDELDKKHRLLDALKEASVSVADEDLSMNKREVVEVVASDLDLGKSVATGSNLDEMT